MPKKAKFKYKKGQSVKIRYYDGSIHTGLVVKAHYRNEEVDYLDTQYTMPVYTVHVPDNSGRYSRGYMSYPCITESMVLSILPTNIQIMPLKDYPSQKIQSLTSVGTTDVSITNSVASELDSAIAQQRKFLNK